MSHHNLEILLKTLEATVAEQKQLIAWLQDKLPKKEQLDRLCAANDFLDTMAKDVVAGKTIGAFSQSCEATAEEIKSLKKVGNYESVAAATVLDALNEKMGRDWIGAVLKQIDSKNGVVKKPSVHPVLDGDPIHPPGTSKAD
jgi:uncharacterized coiled-coil protein SlyX